METQKRFLFGPKARPNSVISYEFPLLSFSVFLAKNTLSFCYIRLYKYKVVLFDPTWDYIWFDSTNVPREVPALKNLGFSTQEPPECSHPSILLSPGLLLMYASSARGPPAWPPPFPWSSRLKGLSVADTTWGGFRIQGEHSDWFPAKQTLLWGHFLSSYSEPQTRGFWAVQPSAIWIPPGDLDFPGVRIWLLVCPTHNPGRGPGKWPLIPQLKAMRVPARVVLKASVGKLHYENLLSLFHSKLSSSLFCLLFLL